MKKETFFKLCNLLRTALEPEPLFLQSREPLSVEKQVAVVLYKATCADYRVVGNVFGINKSTVMKCVYKVVDAINQLMLKKYIYMPNAEEAEDIAINFENMSNIPQIIGIIDGTHIPILAPVDGYKDYLNRKGWTSYVLQAVVDNKCRYRNICIKHPGNTHDAMGFKDSSLYITSKEIIPQMSEDFYGLRIPYMIVGDPAYPLLDWLIKGYPGAVTPAQESFNCYLNSARVSIEMSFGQTKARWRILLKRMDVNHTFVPNIVSACCVLQNFLIDNKEKFNPLWLQDVVSADIINQQSQLQINRERENITGTDIRNHLKDYLAANYPSRKSVFNKE